MGPSISLDLPSVLAQYDAHERRPPRLSPPARYYRRDDPRRPRPRRRSAAVGAQPRRRLRRQSADRRQGLSDLPGGGAGGGEARRRHVRRRRRRPSGCAAPSARTSSKIAGRASSAISAGWASSPRIWSSARSLRLIMKPSTTFLASFAIAPRRLRWAIGLLLELAEARHSAAGPIATSSPDRASLDLPPLAHHRSGGGDARSPAACRASSSPARRPRHDAHGPAGIPYLCDGGQPARIIYEGGGYFRAARARSLYDGRTIEFAAMPPDLRPALSRSRATERPILVWSARGEEAWLAELAADAMPSARSPIAPASASRRRGAWRGRAGHH